MKLLKYITVIILLNLIGSKVNAQEYLRPLSGNMNLQTQAPQDQTHKKVNVTASIQLPFFDDFSYAYKYAYPSYTNWADSNVYVNTGFGIAPITMGVATFDGLNKRGYPYYLAAPASYAGSSDTLTSRPIHLDTIADVGGTHFYTPGDSIALTFYYQAEGFGEAPEATDSLCLDFLKPLADTLRGTWTKVWGKPGYDPSASDTGFYKVKIFITDTAYFHDGFQFRFRNKGRTSGSLDHWHIDYVQIKQLYFYDDTLLNDAAFAYKPSSFLKNYSVIPFRQYNTSEMGTGFHNFFRNNNSIPISATYSYSVRDKNNVLTSDTTFVLDNPGFLPFNPGGYYSGPAATPGFSVSYRMPFSNINTFTDSTHYYIHHILTAGSNNVRKENDTISYIQKFSNYYAYDDGTAEQAYYLGGNTFGAKTAVRYKLNVADTLKSVRIYFDPFTEGNIVQNSGFRLFVWSAAGNSPGSVIYKDSIMYPIYLKDSLIPLSGANKIPTYELTSCLPLSAGSYFIGLQQITGQPLNIGFDRNTNHKSSLYYNLSGNWVQSNINGSIMINPVMGCVDPPPIVGLHDYEKTDHMKLYPNPAQNSITISLSGNQLTTADLEITNALGQTIFTGKFTSNEATDISGLSNGLYFIHIKGNGLNVSPKKLIISR
ncbi:MAG: T9SS type A sorting domain-containing protein [Bacteroidota bacterium]